MPELHDKVITIICKEWPNEDNELPSVTIYEQLVSEGVGVSEAALSDVLIKLADHGDIQLVIAPDLPISQGGMTVRAVDPELCR